jgi:prefoldin subunit 5
MKEQIEKYIKELQAQMDYLYGQINVVDKELLKTTITSLEYAIYNLNKVKESLLTNKK